MFEDAVVAAVHGVGLGHVETAGADALGSTRSFNYLQIQRAME